MEVSLKAGDLVLDPGAADTVETIPASAVLGCMGRMPNEDLETIRSCAQIIYSDLARAEKPIFVKQIDAAMGRDQTYDEYEDRLLALSQLCRAIWAEGGGSADALSTPSCRWVAGGVEKPI